MLLSHGTTYKCDVCGKEEEGRFTGSIGADWSAPPKWHYGPNNIHVCSRECLDIYRTLTGKSNSVQGGSIMRFTMALRLISDLANILDRLDTEGVDLMAEDIKTITHAKTFLGRAK